MKEEEEKSFLCRETNVVMSGVRTRAQKRRIGERDVWDLIVNNDDICFKHILPKLNETDVKFLYGVNTETRALVKRSTRKGELKKWFNVEEMSSISTLEVAWENKSLWSGDLCDERSSFCNKVARTNKLELLEWVRDRINIIKRERIIQKRRRRRRRQQLKKLSFSKK